MLWSLKRKGSEVGGFWGTLSEGARWLGFQNDLPEEEKLVCVGQHFSQRLNKQRSAHPACWSIGNTLKSLPKVV